ncbi:MAG: hypothetical protein WCS94_17045 [Verrucomicrobiota bacterium]
MAFLSKQLGTRRYLQILFFAAALAGAGEARSSDDMLVFSDRLHNGWGDWGWVPHYGTNNPVHGGTNSMCIVPSGGWQAWYLAHDPINTATYTNITFWLHGGAAGGQSVGINITGPASNPRVGFTAQANTWQKIVVPLSSLGAANITNLTGIQIWSNTGSTQAVFLVDDITLVAAPAPPMVHVGLQATQMVRTVDAKIFGINQVAWDGNVYSPTSVGILNDLGNPCLRWPGGSWGDGYHWTNEYRGWGSYSSDFIKLATNTHAQAFIICNYGSSDASEAAFGVRMFNITNHCNFRYWEVGNEVGGAWETDWRQPGFATTDFVNLPAFAAKLSTPTNNISTYLRSQLTSSTLTTLANYLGNNAAYDAALRSALANDLNNCINNTTPSSIYKADTSRFAGITFRSTTWTNLSLPIPNIGQDLNNRMELEDAYPTDLAKITPAVNLASNWPNVYLPHDAWTYAMRFTNFFAQMKAVDPTIKIGAVADITEDGTSNYTNHPVVNPRTGVTHNGWTPVLLTYLRSNNVVPDFLIEHKYPPSDGDTYNLLWSSTWTSDVAGLRQMVTDYLGSAGTNITLECTENGTTGDAQSVSLVGGLLFADSIGQVLQTELNSRLWWDTRNNGPDGGTIANPDPALYGWRTNSSGNFYQDGGIVYNAGGPTNRYPKYYTAKLMTFFAGGGDAVVKVTNDYPLLGTYASKRTNGTLTALVINKSSSSNLTAVINFGGWLPATNATIYSYGISQDTAAQTGIGSPDLQTNLITNAGINFTNTFAPYSASVIAFNPAPPPRLISPAVQAGKFTFQLQGQNGATYVLQYSTNLASGWVPVATNTLAGYSKKITNTTAGAVIFWSAKWVP